MFEINVFQKFCVLVQFWEEIIAEGREKCKRIVTGLVFQTRGTGLRCGRRNRNART